jgi:hypothetical protein
MKSVYCREGHVEYPVYHECPKCHSETGMVLTQAQDDSWGVFGTSQCRSCGDSFDTSAVFRAGLREHRILACDGCGVKADDYGLCTDCYCQCCDGDANQCKCRIETRGRKDELLSDEHGTVYGYSEEPYCTTHRQYMDGEA